jgi:hypothetical protein
MDSDSISDFGGCEDLVEKGEIGMRGHGTVGKAGVPWAGLRRSVLGATAALLLALLPREPFGEDYGDDHVPVHTLQDNMGEHSQSSHAAEGSARAGAAAMPVLPGQDAFGAIEEIVRLLEADPTTDWSKVDLEALRQHLIDMNEVTLHAAAIAEPVDGGVRIAVTGSGRTLEAIRRMVPMHARMIDMMGVNGWNAKTEDLPNGILLTVTAEAPGEVEHIRGLGFIGIMVSGHHHQMHHLAMAKGEMMHH